MKSKCPGEEYNEHMVRSYSTSFHTRLSACVCGSRNTEGAGRRNPWVIRCMDCALEWIATPPPCSSNSHCTCKQIVP